MAISKYITAAREQVKAAKEAFQIRQQIGINHITDLVGELSMLDGVKNLKGELVMIRMPLEIIINNSVYIYSTIDKNQYSVTVNSETLQPWLNFSRSATLDKEELLKGLATYIAENEHDWIYPQKENENATEKSNEESK